MGDRLKKSSKPYRADLAKCHWTGLILGRIDERLSCAGSSLNDRDFRSAEHYIYLTKIDLKESASVLGKSAARRIDQLLDDPYQALKRAQQTIREGKEGRVSRGRLRPAVKAVTKAMTRASNKCK